MQYQIISLSTLDSIIQKNNSVYFGWGGGNALIFRCKLKVKCVLFLFKFLLRLIKNHVECSSKIHIARSIK
jgi:hypothetical protein